MNEVEECVFLQSKPMASEGGLQEQSTHHVSLLLATPNCTISKQKWWNFHPTKTTYQETPKVSKSWNSRIPGFQHDDIPKFETPEILPMYHPIHCWWSSSVRYSSRCPRGFENEFPDFFSPNEGRSSDSFFCRVSMTFTYILLKFTVNVLQYSYRNIHLILW